MGWSCLQDSSSRCNPRELRERLNELNSSYPLGYSEDELPRLASQAAFFEDLTADVVSPSVTISGSAGTSTVKPPSACGSRTTAKVRSCATMLLLRSIEPVYQKGFSGDNRREVEARQFLTHPAPGAVL